MKIVATFEFACEALSAVTNVPAAKSNNTASLPDYMLADNLRNMRLKTSTLIMCN